MIAVRALKSAEDARTLWRFGFPQDGDAFIDAYIGQRSALRDTRALYEDGAIMAGLHIVPQTLVLRGARVPAAMIAGVATAPFARHRGYASRLMRESVAHMAARGGLIAMLDPFLAAFYEPFGYGTACFWSERVHAAPAQGPLLETRDGACLAAVYAASCAEKTLCLSRSRADWAFILRDADVSGERVFVLPDCSAYAIVKAGEADACARETAATSEMARNLLMGRLCAFFGRPVSYRVPARAGEGALMLRPVLLEQILRLVPTACAGRAELNVTDASAPENAGGYAIASNGAGLPRVSRGPVRGGAVSASELLLVVAGAKPARDCAGLDARGARALGALYPEGCAAVYEKY